jgi:hypothetical protein
MDRIAAERRAVQPAALGNARISDCNLPVRGLCGVLVTPDRFQIPGEGKTEKRSIRPGEQIGLPLRRISTDLMEHMSLGI